MVVFTDHALKRLNQRGIDGSYIKRQLQLIPRHSAGTTMKYKLKGGMFAVISDKPEFRAVITVGWTNETYKKRRRVKRR